MNSISLEFINNSTRGMLSYSNITFKITIPIGFA